VKAGIIDGPATDLSEIEEFDLPMWCRGLSAITTRLLGIEGALNVPISVGGQVVNPGDAVLADENGAIVFPADLARRSAERAVAMQKAEATTHKRLRAGEKLPDITGATAIVEAKLIKSTA
jgi:4-hydroxy-4-methyl-2-oxoglutarate aldolase